MAFEGFGDDFEALSDDGCTFLFTQVVLLFLIRVLTFFQVSWVNIAISVDKLLIWYSSQFKGMTVKQQMNILIALQAEAALLLISTLLLRIPVAYFMCLPIDGEIV